VLEVLLEKQGISTTKTNKKNNCKYIWDRLLYLTLDKENFFKDNYDYTIL